MILRRQFLTSAAVTGIAMLCELRSFGLRVPTSREELRRESTDNLLSSLLVDASAARTIGARFLALYPSERDKPAAFRELLLRRIKIEQSSGRVSSPRRIVDALRKRDFQTGRIVVVDGWVLSQSEACACALYA